MADFHSLPITSQFSENKDPDSTLLDQKILLVCVINYKRINITFDFLYNMFNSYGEVKKVSLFYFKLSFF